MAGFSDVGALAKLLQESFAAEGAPDEPSILAGTAAPVAAAAKARSSTTVRVGGVPVPPPAASGGAAAGGSAAAGSGGGREAPSGGKSKEIWEEAEVADKADVEDARDSRKRPRFEFLFMQRVGSEDVFLGLQGTTPSSIHCDTLVVRIELPGEALRDIDLDVTPDRIVVQASKHKLTTFLPLRVLDKEGGAKWDARKEVLAVTLPIDKEARETAALGLGMNPS